MTEKAQSAPQSQISFTVSCARCNWRVNAIGDRHVSTGNADHRKDLGVAPGAVQITLTAYTAGFAIGQLIHGPLADSFGRRPVLILGVLFFGLAAVVSATTNGIDALTYVRTAQGFAGAAAAVIIQAVVRDMFDREDFARNVFRHISYHDCPVGCADDWRSPCDLVWMAFYLLGAGYLCCGCHSAGVLENSGDAKTRNRQPLRFRTTLKTTPVCVQVLKRWA